MQHTITELPALLLGSLLSILFFEVFLERKFKLRKKLIQRTHWLVAFALGFACFVLSSFFILRFQDSKYIYAGLYGFNFGILYYFSLSSIIAKPIKWDKS